MPEPKKPQERPGRWERRTRVINRRTGEFSRALNGHSESFPEEDVMRHRRTIEAALRSRGKINWERIRPSVVYITEYRNNLREVGVKAALWERSLKRAGIGLDAMQQSHPETALLFELAIGINKEGLDQADNLLRRVETRRGREGRK